MFKLIIRFRYILSLLVLVLFFYLIKDYIINSFLYKIAISPVEYFYRVTFPISNTARNLVTIFDIIEERDSLKNQLASISYDKALAYRLKLENSLLRDQLGLSDKKEYNFIEAEIDIVNNNLASKTITINKGTLDGVSKDMAVIIPGNILVGQIKEVHDNYSVVQLITDKKFNASSILVDRGVVGELKSNDSEGKIIDLIKTNEVIEKDDVIATSGIDKLPAGLLIGVVSNVSNNDGALFKSIEARLFFNYFNNPIVFIVK